MAAVLLAASSLTSARTLTWSVVPSPNPSNGLNVELNDVSCISATACTAAGYYTIPGEYYRTLAESWDGKHWSVLPTPSPGPGDYTEFNGVSCVSATACTAAGFYAISGDHDKTLVESWDGTRWSVVASPSPGFYPYFDDVSCVSATRCTAVGFTGQASPYSGRTLVESWQGTRWSVVPSPHPGFLPQLVGVSCVSATACMAVGSYSRTPRSPLRTLAETWNGTRWSVVPSPSPGPGDTVLVHVSCVSATRCTAVGGYRAHTGAHGNKTLVESWNGTRWSVVPSPSPTTGGGDIGLDGVSCVSATACTAVGWLNPRNITDVKTLVESWNGTRWTVVPSPSPSQPDSALSRVSCVSATVCIAAGDRGGGRHPSKTLIEAGTAAPSQVHRDHHPGRQ